MDKTKILKKTGDMTVHLIKKNIELKQLKWKNETDVKTAKK